MKSSAYQRQVKAGLALLQHRLEELGKSAGKIGHTKGAAYFNADAESIKAVLEKPTQAEPEAASPGERLMFQSGLRLLAHNLKAASGTVTALGRLDLADDFRAEAEEIEQDVLPRLEEQTALRLHTAEAGG